MKILLNNFIYCITALILFVAQLISQPIKPEKLSYYNLLADNIINSALSDQSGYEWLKELCDIGPRLSGSDNSIIAIRWAEKKLKEIGCDSVWLQSCMVPKWERGVTEQAEITRSESFEGRDLIVASLGGSIGTPLDGITAEVIEVRNFDTLKTLADKIKGKIVFFNRSLDQTKVNSFNGYGGAVNQRINGASEAAKYGAVAVFVRSISTKYDNNPHVGVVTYQDSIPRIPAAAIGQIDADFLSKAIQNQSGLNVTLEMDCRNLDEVESYNVIGEIRGTEFPNEVIVVGGHFDSWDKGCGAHDDGAPCIQTMEILDLFRRSNIHPKRTIRCVLFINEENGLRGAKKYGDYADSSNQIHIAAIEADRGAFTPRGFFVTTDSLTLPKLQTWLPILNKSLIDWIKPGGSGADVSQIKNVKALFGFAPDSQRYMDVHHSANDSFESVHPREMELGSAAMAILTLLLSEEGI
ncbi:MAG: M20/M25/M40 family metallo-hydrolase [bacterium]